jgi:DNA-binding NtrC family response regulator
MGLHRILVASKDAEIQQLAHQVAREVFLADDLAEAFEITEAIEPELIVLDVHFDAANIQRFIHKTEKQLTGLRVVIAGNDQDDEPLCGRLMQMGAVDYLRGPHDYKRLLEIADVTAGGNERIKDDNTSHFFAEEFASAVSMVGRSESILNTLRMIRLVAKSHCNPVLILGETGTGKELATRAVHNLRHADEQFVAVNCAALTATLLESELFGHVKGSFTGADRDKTGLFEATGCGTILLDEISEMPLHLQAKLLRVLQEKTFRRVGGLKDIACTATVVASSNCNLKKQVQANRFRRDLYYRLNICPITLAPLRSVDRRSDIKLLAEYFLRTSAICPNKAAKITCFTKLAVEALEKHDWPGNVRELRNLVEKAILLETTDKIGLSSILFDSPEYDEQSNEAGCTQQHHIKDFSLAKAERELIARALRETGWKKTQAATLLGITRATLYAKVKQYNIEKEPSRVCTARTNEDGLNENADKLRPAHVASAHT